MTDALRHTASEMLAVLAARQLFRIDIGRLPSTLRQLKRSLLDRVTKLLDQIDRVALL